MVPVAEEWVRETMVIAAVTIDESIVEEWSAWCAVLRAGGRGRADRAGADRAAGTLLLELEKEAWPLPVLEARRDALEVPRVAPAKSSTTRAG
jgi:hypothetical protein